VRAAPEGFGTAPEGGRAPSGNLCARRCEFADQTGQRAGTSGQVGTLRSLHGRRGNGLLNPASAVAAAGLAEKTGDRSPVSPRGSTRRNAEAAMDLAGRDRSGWATVQERLRETVPRRLSRVRPVAGMHFAGSLGDGSRCGRNLKGLARRSRPTLRSGSRGEEASFAGGGSDADKTRFVERKWLGKFYSATPIHSVT